VISAFKFENRHLLKDINAAMNGVVKIDQTPLNSDEKWISLESALRRLKTGARLNY
jgi:hypothetical protein